MLSSLFSADLSESGTTDPPFAVIFHFMPAMVVFKRTRIDFSGRVL